MYSAANNGPKARASGRETTRNGRLDLDGSPATPPPPPAGATSPPGITCLPLALLSRLMALSSRALRISAAHMTASTWANVATRTARGGATDDLAGILAAIVTVTPARARGQRAYLALHTTPLPFYRAPTAGAGVCV